jgi:hypothetical protein
VLALLSTSAGVQDAALDRYNARLTAELTADDAVPTLPAHVKRRLRKASTSRLTLGVPFNVTADCT